MPTKEDLESAADLAVIDTEGSDAGLSLRNGDVPRPVVAHQDDVVVPINGIILREGTACTQQVHDFHRLDILDLKLAGDRTSARSKQRIAKDNGADRILVLGNTCSHMVVGKGAEPLFHDETIECDGSAGGAHQLPLGAIVPDIELPPEFLHAVHRLRIADNSSQGAQFLDF